MTQESPSNDDFGSAPLEKQIEANRKLASDLAAANEALSYALADQKRLQAMLEKVYSSTSWRVSSPLRSIGLGLRAVGGVQKKIIDSVALIITLQIGRSSPLVRSIKLGLQVVDKAKKEIIAKVALSIRLHVGREIRLDPLHEVEGVPGLANVTDWTMKGDDPQFGLVWGEAERLPPGYYQLDVEVPSGREFLASSHLYVDTGLGYYEASRLDPNYRLSRNGYLKATLPLPKDVRAIRFDPSDQPGQISIGRVRLRKLITIYPLLALLMRTMGYRFIVVTIPGRIGHLAIEVDFFLKLKALGRFAGIKPIMLMLYSNVANQALLRAWAKHVTLLSNPSLVRFLNPLKNDVSLCVDLHHVAGPLEEAAQYQLAVNSWGDRPPIFKLPAEIIAKGRASLEALGMPRDAWFVCVHARDPVYSPGDETAHNYRNSDINKCSLAADAIIARGGWVVRMGEKGTPSLSDRPGLINYPDTPLRSDWMDLFLPSQARFFLGNTSGICLISTIAGVPCALTNMIPYGACYGMGKNDIAIPKGLRRVNGDTPSLNEIFASDVSNFRYADQYERHGWFVEENTQEQILDLTVEMLDRLDGSFQSTPEQETLQNTFRRLLTPRHYTYGTTSRIGCAFLAENASDVIPDDVLVRGSGISPN